MKRLCFSFALLGVSLCVFPWSTKGHQVITLIAKEHLSDEAYAALNTLLDGYSIVYYSVWLDQVKNEPEYSHTYEWHYINVDPWETYENRSSLSGIDAVTALYQQSDVLRSPSSSAEEKAFAAKVILHVVGDLHNPLHCGHKSDLGGNTIKLTYKGKDTNLHAIWDYYMVNDAHLWSSYDWVKMLDDFTDEEVEQLSAGTIDDWAKESVALAALVYDWFPAGYAVTQEDVDEWTPEIEKQFSKGGLRLAALFNDIYSSNTSVDVLPSEDAVPEEYYTLQGVKIQTPGESTLLPPGVYVTNVGRKIVVRR